MKNYSRHLLQSKYFFPAGALFLLGAFIRLYNYSDRILYGPEQAMSLIVSGNYLREKISLLGQPYFRQTLSGQTLYSGAWFNYSLVPLQYIFRHDIILISMYFTILNLLTGAVIYKLLSIIFNRKIAPFSLFIFLFDPYMVYHSLFLWNYNYLPLLFAVSVFLTYRFARSKRPQFAFILGLLSGIGISLQLMYLIPFLILLLITLRYGGLRSVLLFLLGAAVGDLPLLLFDLRHGFYQTKNILLYFSQVLLQGGAGGLAYYHFLYLWPVLAIAGGLALDRIVKKSRTFGILTAGIYLILAFSSPMLDFGSTPGTIKGLKAGDIYNAAGIIAADSSGCRSFNVVEMYDFDTRAHILRYPLIFKYNAVPGDYVSYKRSECVYSLSTDEYNYNKADMWEINEIKPFRITKLVNVGDGHAVFKLTHD